jgi:thiosulfate/3-mercaptopyruvate sulfurtransferase
VAGALCSAGSARRHDDAQPAYSTPMSLISVEELATRLDDPQLRVVDVRWYLNRPGQGRQAYESGHIPTAIFLDLDEDLSGEEGDGRHPLPHPLDFRRRLEAAGIGSEHFVVAYDDTGGTTAVRLWWMLDNLGHPAVAVLDGGIQAWIAAGHSLSRDEPTHPKARLTLGDRWSRTIVRAELVDKLGTVTLLDARAPERYRGEVEPIDPAAGHIPTAVNAPTAGNLADDGRFLPPDRLAARFADLAPGGNPVVTSCGSGTTACHNALAMRLAGLPDPILYVGSFSDWSRAGMPIATGPEPGRPPLEPGGPPAGP